VGGGDSERTFSGVEVGGCRMPSRVARFWITRERASHPAPSAGSGSRNCRGRVRTYVRRVAGRRELRGYGERRAHGPARRGGSWQAAAAWQDSIILVSSNPLSSNAAPALARVNAQTHEGARYICSARSIRRARCNPSFLERWMDGGRNEGEDAHPACSSSWPWSLVSCAALDCSISPMSYAERAAPRSRLASPERSRRSDMASRRPTTRRRSDDCGRPEVQLFVGRGTFLSARQLLSST